MTATTVTGAGFTRQTLADTIAEIQSSVRGVYGADVNIDLATPDGQLINAVARAVDHQAALLETVNAAIDVRTATKNALSGRLRLNGITRAAGTASIISLALVGTAGKVIPAGTQVKVDNNTTYALASPVTLTATTVYGSFVCTTVGANVVTGSSTFQILTPIYGWQTVAFGSQTLVGTNYEIDPLAQIRRANSVALPSQTVVAAVRANVLAVPDCVQARVYENDGDLPAAVGATALRGHSILVLAYNGQTTTTPAFDTAVATAISLAKAPGCGTVGLITVSLTDVAGVTYFVNYSAPTLIPITLAFDIRKTAGWPGDTAGDLAIQTAVFNAINSGLYDANGVLIAPRQEIGGAFAPLDYTSAVHTVPGCRVQAVTVYGLGPPFSSGEHAFAADEIGYVATISDISVTHV